jgi:hypothetical protein
MSAMRARAVWFRLLSRWRGDDEMVLSAVALSGLEIGTKGSSRPWGRIARSSWIWDGDVNLDYSFRPDSYGTESKVKGSSLTFRSSSWSFASDDTRWISESQLTGARSPFPDWAAFCASAICGADVTADGFAAGAAGAGAVDMAS